VTFGGRGQEVTTAAPNPQQPGAPPSGGPKSVIYTRVDGRPEILLVADSNMSDLQKTDMDLRDKRILDIVKENVKAMQVERKQGTSFTAERSGPDTWRLTAPSPQKANKTKLDDLVWDITELEAKGVPG